MKSFTLDGKRHRVHPRVPIQSVRWLVGRQHVGTDDAEIEKLITDRALDWPRAAIDSAKKLAVWFHRQNQNLVREMRL
ncbi:MULTISPECIES: hypothetical protein [unclassified Mesorhizobium]|uniref:hypothetical protein n=1 Tax=unclassified Mesorhizobium TaxID=325217 RepID=UPI00112CE49C|nr:MULTISPECIES: hypothetical protein [unclassified Mesorhizobium]TPL42583.1 hypothetical protein FJ961_07795 [Mesorhizobium sp. B2-4-5]TPL66583.1 hypothetical protein FJ949_09455 [Mesorhizobium sp. B2-4-1]